jgi:hypothetical protein
MQLYASSFRKLRLGPCNYGFEIDLDYLKYINLNFKGKKIKVDAP